MFIHLKNRALLKVSGSDAENFLQGQLSNDIKQLNTSSVQLNAYCQHQGKILALFWVMKYEDSFLLSFPLDLLETIKPRLQMFVIMSDVTIDDVTPSYLQIGTLDEKHQSAYAINDKLSVIIQDTKDSNKFNDIRNNARNTIIENYDLETICLPKHLELIKEVLNEDRRS